MGWDSENQRWSVSEFLRSTIPGACEVIIGAAEDHRTDRIFTFSQDKRGRIQVHHKDKLPGYILSVIYAMIAEDWPYVEDTSDRYKMVNPKTEPYYYGPDEDPYKYDEETPWFGLPSASRGSVKF